VENKLIANVMHITEFKPVPSTKKKEKRKRIQYKLYWLEIGVTIGVHVKDTRKETSQDTKDTYNQNQNAATNGLSLHISTKKQDS
jgi:hypothetical protein